MLRWEHLESASVPGGGKLTLHRRGDEYSIRIDGDQLMNSRLHDSEEELARLACPRIRDRPRPRVLIGGLGMGFMVSAALAALGKTAEVVVAELVPAVVMWNRKDLGHLAGDPLEDPRVVVHEGDVVRLLHGAKERYDAVLLDVDNGPAALTSDRNSRLYDMAGLATAQQALRPAGIYGVWSAGPDRQFTERLRQSGMEVEEISASARARGKGGRHTLWLGTRPAT